MDRDRFDALVRSLGRAATRRDAVAASTQFQVTSIAGAPAMAAPDSHASTDAMRSAI